jgi:hypothetical protein
MKKIVLLIAAVVLSATTGMVNSSNSINSSAQAAGRVPEAVVNSFNENITNIVDTWFPGNSGWDGSQVSWDHVKSDWKCNGIVTVNGATGHVQVIDAMYHNNGQLLYMYYDVVQ